MRVLQIISSANLYGAERVILNLAKELQNRGNEVLIVNLFRAKDKEKGSAVIEEARRLRINSQDFHCSGKFDLKAIRALKKFILKNRIDIVHSHGYKSNFYSLLASSGTNYGRVTTCHNWISEEPKMKFYKWLDKLLLKKFDKVVAVSETLRDEIVRSGVAERKVEVIENGIDVDKCQVSSVKCQVKESLGIEQDEKIVGMVGRLTEEKGHIYLLKAAKEVVKDYPKVKFLIVGDGPLRNSLQSIVDSLQLNDNVMFTGIRNDIPELLIIMDVFVMPSLKEGMPMALLEAMAAEKPVVATKVGAVPKIIDDGKNGLLVDSGNIEKLSDAIIELLKNTEKANLLAQNGYEKVKNEFSSEKMTGKYLEIYNTLMAKVQ